MAGSFSLENSTCPCRKLKHHGRVTTYMDTHTWKICKVAWEAIECVHICSLQNTANVHRETLKLCPTQSLNFFFLLHSKWVIGKEHQASIHRPLEVSMEKWTLHARLVIHFLLRASGFYVCCIPENAYCQESQVMAWPGTHGHYL